MSTKFFNNTPEHSLFEKFKGIAKGMSNFHSFWAVVGYFRSSGYFKLRKELGNVQDIRILVGINIDSIFRKYNQALLMLDGDEEAKQIYTKDFVQDVRDAQYDADVEEGILQMCEDIVSGKLQMRIHKSKNLHAKFYLCLPQNFNPNTDGWVLMGSSNISDSGLGITTPPRYELNVAMKDYDDVAYCKNEFEMLWNEGIPITAEDIERMRRQTHLEDMPTPYEIFIKVLIDAFGTQVEDSFTLEMPKGYMQLKYQNDAAIQGFQMLKQYNGFFLADVVGTGKTIVAAMIAKRFVEENGKNTKILVVYPPAVKDNWQDTFSDFGLTRYAQFISNGSLSKVLSSGDNYWGAEEIDLVIVDEAHNFRSDTSDRYDDLQRICKIPRLNPGMIDGPKKVMLLSATPLNNRPEDFRNLILLFQDARKPTLDGITNITTLFQPWIKQYNELMRKRGKIDNQEITTAADQIYEDIRTHVLDKILVRRTRKNLWNNAEYRADLQHQGIHFPCVEQPEACIYQLGQELSTLFYDTITILTDTPDADNPTATGLHYARYRAIEFITDADKASKYRNAKQFAQVFSGIFRVHMVKRLESSFYAFKKSLHTFLRITNDMIRMWENNQILIAPEIDVKGMMAKDIEFDEIIEKAIEQGYTKDEILFTQTDFSHKYIDLLREDAQKLQELVCLWDKVEADPKFDKFQALLQNELLKPTKQNNGKTQELNREGKLVIFSESVDTITYIADRLKNELHSTDVLLVSAANRKHVLKDIRENFDANFSGEKQNKYNIIIASDVLAEGVNLHRANVIVNYDSPWNATRLMQRIGRVNRIGSASDHIYNYMFYPSQDGDEQIQLYTNALIKLQSFHSALGEDAQVYSQEEILREFQLFDEHVHDNVDKRLELMREVRELYTHNPERYKYIKALPCKSRTVRKETYRPSTLMPQSTIIYITTDNRSQFYKVMPGAKPMPIEFLEAAEILRAKAEEPIGDFQMVKAQHYQHVRKAYESYTAEVARTETTDTSLNEKLKDSNTTAALAFLKAMQRQFATEVVYNKIVVLRQYVDEGIFSALTLKLNRLNRELNRQKKTSRMEGLKPWLQHEIETLFDHYYMATAQQNKEKNLERTEIITSETFE